MLMNYQRRDSVVERLSRHALCQGSRVHTFSTGQTAIFTTGFSEKGVSLLWRVCQRKSLWYPIKFLIWVPSWKYTKPKLRAFLQNLQVSMSKRSRKIEDRSKTKIKENGQLDLLDPFCYEGPCQNNYWILSWACPLDGSNVTMSQYAMLQCSIGSTLSFMAVCKRAVC